MKKNDALYVRLLVAVVFSISLVKPALSQVGISDNLLGIAPQSILHVHSNSTTGNLLQLTNNISGNTMPYHGFAIKGDPDFKVTFANQYSHINAGIGFSTNISGVHYERMTILNNGNIGIGMMNPGQRLSVAGTFGLLETGTSPTFYTALQSGDLSGSLAFTLPNSYGTTGQSLISDGLGNLSWSSRETPLTFGNGLTRAGSAVKLGGALTENTTILQTGSQTFNFTSTSTGNSTVNLAGSGNFDLQDNGTSFFFGSAQGNVGIGTTTPTNKLYVVGDIYLNYPGSNNGFTVSGSTPLALGHLQNDYPGDTWGFSGGCGSPSAGANSMGINGFNHGAGYGVLGRSQTGYGMYGVHVASGNFGYLGGNLYGVFGKNYVSLHYGYIGGSLYGVYGSHSNNNYGLLGAGSFGVYGFLATTNAGEFAVFGYGPHASGVNGSGYGGSATLGAVKGYCWYGNSYTFATTGYSYLDYTRSGGTLGAIESGSVWGCLAYKNSSGTVYGAYFTSSLVGTGKTPAGTMINSGVGAWGDLFGADIHGKVYGLYTEGADYASFDNGNTFRNGLDVHLQKTGSGENAVLYTHVSTDATIQTCGYATLDDGRCDVAFDPAFSAAVSGTSPVVVTVTPMGNTGGVYLAEVSTGGFKAVENNNGKSTVQISYMAIGKRAGHEKPVLPEAVVSSGYVEKLAEGLHNDNDLQSDGKGLYYENGRLEVGKHPSTLPDPGKPARDPGLKEPAGGTSMPRKEPSGAKPVDRGNGLAPSPGIPTIPVRSPGI